MIVQTDKLLHFSFSALLVVSFAAVGFGWLSPILALAIGGGKELVWDKLMKLGDPSWGDFLADSIGVLFGILLMVIHH